MIYSVARADVDEATHANLLGAWSDLVVGNRPTGLVDSYLLKSEGTIQIVAAWNSLADHDRAIHEDGAHPGHVVFEAAGLDCTHTVYDVLGSVHQR
jgi:hypothetical protein